MPIEIDFYDFEKYAKFISNLERANQGRVDLVLRRLRTLEPEHIFASDTVKSLGQGLFELRIEKKPELLVRIFFCVDGFDRLVVLHAYDKKRNNKINWQRKQIAQARHMMKLLK